MEFEKIKNNLITNLVILKNKNYYNLDIQYSLDELIDIITKINYPIYLDKKNYDKINYVNINNKIIFYHKLNSFDIKKNYNQKSDYINSYYDNSDDEDSFLSKQRKTIKNNIMVKKNIDNKNNFIKNKIPKESKINSRNVSFNWTKSFISI